MSAFTTQERAAGSAVSPRSQLSAVEVRVRPSGGHHGLRALARAATLLISAMFVMALNAHPAQAHAVLVRSDPESGSTVAEPPALIRLWFSEEISHGVSSARLVDDDGTTVDGARMASRQDDPRLLELEVPQLGTGTYGVLWQVLTEDDGHTTNGILVFGVGVSATSLWPAAGAVDAPPALDVALRWARLCSLAGLVGALAVVSILRRVGVTGSAALAPTLRSARNRILLLAIGCGWLGVSVALADLLEAVQRLRTPGISWVSTGGELLSGTRWGHLWLAREAALLTLVPVLVAMRTVTSGVHRRPTPLIVASSATLAIIWIEAIGSHAAAVESDRAVAVAADALHILAACLWLGALATLVLMLWPQTGAAASGIALVRACRGPFTTLMAASVGVLLVTGLYSAGRQVQSVDDLLTTSYGRTLLVKSGLLAVLLSLGLVNANRLHGMRPWLRSMRRLPAARPAPRRMVVAEAGVGALLLLAVGVLAETAPAREQAPSQAASEAQTRSGTVADLVVTISATPNRPGLNAFTVIAASTRRPPPAAIDSVQLEFTTDDVSSVLTLRHVGPQRYFGTTQVETPGSIRIEAVFHRAGQRLTVPLFWQLGPSLEQQQAGGGRSHRLAPYVDGMALLLIAAAALAGAGHGLRRRSARQRQQEADVLGPATGADRIPESCP